MSATIWHEVSEEAITVLRNDNPSFFPLSPTTHRRVAYVGIGINEENRFAERLRKDYGAHIYFLNHPTTQEHANAMLAVLKNSYDVVVVGVHSYARYPANNFGIDSSALDFVNRLDSQQASINFFFGNPYAVRSACAAKSLIACYDDYIGVQEIAADLLNGKFYARGKLPVSVCPQYSSGAGIVINRPLPEISPALAGFDEHKLQAVDSIVNDAIAKRAIPGCVVLAVKDGKVIYDKAYGFMTYDSTELVYPGTLYDLASCTKIMATTLSVMKLYEEGKLDIHKTLGDYLPWTRGTNKAGLLIEDVLLHQAGLKDYIPFFRETLDSTHNGIPSGMYYAPKPYENFTVRVANNLYLRNDYVDTMYARILASTLGPRGKYVYSDNDFIFLGKVVQQISGLTLDEYAKQNFYDRLGLETTGFLPRNRFSLSRIAPTENEPIFRNQLIRGDVHDPGAAMFGGVSGHAGLFSDAYDLAIITQMLMNGGTFNGVQFFKPSTIEYFTAYHSDISRRGYGWDKPEKDNLVRKEPYPCLSASPLTFGHTGFTGTCIWVDPKYKFTFIFLSNRVNNNGDANRFLKMNIRPKVQETFYQAMSN